MDCNNNQRMGCTCRPQMTPPPCMNTDSMIQPRDSQIMPGQIMPGQIMPDVGTRERTMDNCMTAPGGAAARGMRGEPGQINGTVLAMGYVPWQRWGQTYSMEDSLKRGTIFPELDLPFVMGRCRG